jgi:hypothetical protein
MSLALWPAAILPSSYSLVVAANTQSGGRSPFDGSEQTLELPGAKWVARLVFEGLDRDEHRHLQAWVNGQRGRAGRFRWGPPSQPLRGTAAAAAVSPRIRGAGQSGAILATQGWQANVGTVFAPGDFLSFEVSGRAWLHQVSARSDGLVDFAGSNASGWCDFTVSPPLRRPPADNAALNIAAPVGTFRLSADRNPFEFETGMFGAIILEIEEAIP